MALENNWVTYLQRSYKSIKSAILTRMVSIVPEITDYSESNIFVIIIASFAGLVEQLNYYIDNVARECYIATARRYSSMVKITKLIDYRVKAKIAATVDLKITAVDASGDPVSMVSDETLASGLIVEDSSGVQFITQASITIFSGTSYATVGARQRVKVTDENIGTTVSSANQTLQLDDDYNHDTLQLTINSITWDLRETFAFSGPNSTHFIVEVNENKQAYVTFGDDVNGAIPPVGQSILATYYTCSGVSGNVEADTIDVWDSEPTPPTQTPVIANYTITNELSAVGGLDEEGIEDIRKRAPLSLRTLDRAVTQQDHDDLCLLVPGVGKAKSLFNSQDKTITFYIAPEEGGTASSLLLADVITYFETRKMISTIIASSAAGQTILRISLTVTAKFRRNITELSDDIDEALQNEYGFNNSSVDRPIRKSDITALIDNLDKVDYLSLDIITTKPYPRVILGTNPLEENWLITINSTSSEIAYWRMDVTSSTAARIYRTGPSGTEVFDGTITIVSSEPGSTNYTSNDGTISLAIWGTFTINDRWQFTTYPYNEDITFEDYTVPIYDLTELDLTINEQVGL